MNRDEASKINAANDNEKLEPPNPLLEVLDKAAYVALEIGKHRNTPILFGGAVVGVLYALISTSIEHYGDRPLIYNSYRAGDIHLAVPMQAGLVDLSKLSQDQVKRLIDTIENDRLTVHVTNGSGEKICEVEVDSTLLQQLNDEKNEIPMRDVQKDPETALAQVADICNTSISEIRGKIHILPREKPVPPNVTVSSVTFNNTIRSRELSEGGFKKI